MKYRTLIAAPLSLIFVGLFWKNNLLTLTLLILSSIILLYKAKKEEYILFILCAISGAIAEIIAITGGAWTYNNNSFLGIPYWLPILWGIAGIFMYRVGRILKNYFS